MIRAILSLIVVTACYQPPASVAPTRAPHPVQASFDKTWNAVIDVFADRNIPLRTLDRSSGFAATEQLSVGSEDSPQWADCGANEGGQIGPTRAAYNVLVRGDSTHATVRVTVSWSNVDKGVTCVTSGVWETDAERQITAIAEGRPAPGPVATIDTMPWVASRSTMAYYPTSCALGKAIDRYARVYFKTESDARAKGYQRGRGC